MYNLFMDTQIQATFHEPKCENFGKKTENIGFGDEGVFWAIYGLGKSCGALQITFKNFFLQFQL